MHREFVRSISDRGRFVFPLRVARVYVLARIRARMSMHTWVYAFRYARSRVYTLLDEETHEGSCIIDRVPYSGEALKSPTTRLKSITVINVRFVPLEYRLKYSYCIRQNTTVRACSLNRVVLIQPSKIRNARLR